MYHEALIKAVAAQTNADARLVREVLAAVVDVVGDALVAGGKARLLNLGTLTAQPTKARTGRNPRSGESVAVPAGVKVKFKSAAAMIDRLA
jgi:DNA-binding protein HU-beta